MTDDDHASARIGAEPRSHVVQAGLVDVVQTARFRGKPPDVQVTASGFATATAFMRTGQSDEAVPPRPSETRTVTVADAGGVMPVLSKVAVAPVPVTRPAEALHS